MDLKVEGAGELVNRLSRFDRDVYKVLQREVREASEQVAADARKRLPSEKVLHGGRSTGRERPSEGWGRWNHTTGPTGSSFGSISFGSSTSDWGYEGNRARKSVKSQARQYRRSKSLVGIIGRVTMTDPGAIMYALMGKVPTGSRFERSVVQRYGESQYPRALGPAWTKFKDAAGRRIDEAIDRARISIGL